MTNDLVISLVRIIGSVILLAVVLGGVSVLARRLKMHPETARKIIHVSLGLYCLTFPWIFDEAWEVAAVCLMACGIFLIARNQKSLGEGLHGVKRFSYGELLFAVSVAMLFWLKDGHYVLALHGVQSEPQLILYILPLMVLTLCDAASALVGVNYGRIQFQVEEGVKSVEGVVTFILTAWLASLIALLLFTDLERGHVIVLALITALFGALFEAASWRGLDNLFIPVGLYFLLSNLLPHGAGELLIATVAFALGSGLLMLIGVRLGLKRHVVAAGMSVLFCVAIFAGALATLTPIAAFGVYFVAWRSGARRHVPHDALNLIVTTALVALALFALSALLQADTIFAFNLALASLACGVLIWFSRLPPVWSGMAVIAICAVASVRPFVEPLGQEGRLQLTGIMLALLLGSALIFRLTRGRWSQRPWLKLGAVALMTGVVSLPFSPDGFPSPGLLR